MNQQARNALKYLRERAKEVSTWQGIVMIVSAAGWHLAPDYRELVLMIGPGVAGFLSVIMPEGDK